jgi:hypothetical protein
VGGKKSDVKGVTIKIRRFQAPLAEGPGRSQVPGAARIARFHVDSVSRVLITHEDALVQAGEFLEFRLKRDPIEFTPVVLARSLSEPGVGEQRPNDPVQVMTVSRPVFAVIITAEDLLNPESRVHNGFTVCHIFKQFVRQRDFRQGILFIMTVTLAFDVRNDLVAADVPVKITEFWSPLRAACRSNAGR